MSARSARDADGLLVVAFLNTLDLEAGDDELDGQDRWAAWAARHGALPGGPVGAARRARDALRAAAAGDEPGVEATAPVAAGVVDGRPRLVPADLVGAVLLAAARLAEAGDWGRVKLCASEACRWAFLDGSRNRSRAWCSMEVCGNRAKARSFRSRARAHSD